MASISVDIGSLTTHALPSYHIHYYTIHRTLYNVHRMRCRRDVLDAAQRSSSDENLNQGGQGDCSDLGTRLGPRLGTPLGTRLGTYASTDVDYYVNKTSLYSLPRVHSHCTLYTLQCIFYTVQCILYTVHCIMYITAV